MLFVIIDTNGKIALNNIGCLSFVEGRYEEARLLFEEAMSLHREELLEEGTIVNYTLYMHKT